MLLNYLFQFMEATNKDTACIIKQNLARWVWWVKWVWEPGEPYLKLGFSCISPLLLFSLGCCWEAKYVISSSHQLLPSFRWRTAAESTCVELKYHQKERKKNQKNCVFFLKLVIFRKFELLSQFVLTKTSSLASADTVEKESFCCPIILQEGPVIEQSIRIAK